MSDSKLHFEMTCLVCFIYYVLSTRCKNAKRPLRMFQFIFKYLSEKKRFDFKTFIHTIQSHYVHPSPFAEARLLESSSRLRSGLPYSKPTHYQLSCAASQDFINIKFKQRVLYCIEKWSYRLETNEQCSSQRQRDLNDHYLGLFMCQLIGVVRWEVQLSMHVSATPNLSSRGSDFRYSKGIDLRKKYYLHVWTSIVKLA